jgi:hypothetical protein
MSHYMNPVNISLHPCHSVKQSTIPLSIMAVFSHCVKMIHLCYFTHSELHPTHIIAFVQILLQLSTVILITR